MNYALALQIEQEINQANYTLKTVVTTVKSGFVATLQVNCGTDVGVYVLDQLIKIRSEKLCSAKITANEKREVIFTFY